jgi:O-antigen/teichoic acid export membrane protein
LNQKEKQSEPSLKEKTAKGLFWEGISNIVQQLIGAIFGIAIARILSPGDYGLVGMLAIFTAIANTIMDSGFTLALANKKKIRHEDYNAVFWFSVLTGIILYVILFFTAPLIARFYDRPELTGLSRLLFLTFLIGSTGFAHHAILYKKKW